MPEMTGRNKVQLICSDKLDSRENLQSKQVEDWTSKQTSTVVSWRPLDSLDSDGLLRVVPLKKSQKSLRGHAMTR